MTKKNNHDYLLKVSVKDYGFQAVLGRFTDLCNHCVCQHRIKDAGAKLFADALTASALLVSQRQAPDEKYTIRFDCDGVICGFILDSNDQGALRGLPKNTSAGTAMQWNTAADLEDLCGVKGSTVEITRSIKGRVVGTGKLETAFLQPSMALGYFVSVGDGVETEISAVTSLRPNPEAPLASADGMMLQVLPDCDLVRFEQIRNRLQESAAKAILADSGLTAEDKLQKILKYILPENAVLPEEETVQTLERVRFGCTCSREHIFAMAVRMLGREDLLALLNEKPVTGMRCHFCNTEYQFTADDLKKL